MVIAQWIPTIVIAYIDEDYERRSPPTMISKVSTARTPGPVAAVIYPTSVVVRRPTPRLVTDPGPAIRGTPHPVTITIRRPIRIDVDDGIMRSPDPTVVRRVRPITIRVEIFSAPDITVVILCVVTKSFREIALAIIDPLVPRIRRTGSEQFPIACVGTINNQVGGTPIS